jgi:hypothetical protein
MSHHRDLRVGGLTVPYDEASAWVTAYLDAPENRRSKKPYAYPAYDLYNSDEVHPDRITDADLLAPALLNVTVSIRAFYGLQAIRDDLEQALPPVDTPALEEVSVSQVSELVKPVYAILDDPTKRPHKVLATTLSKIVHRKRPAFLVLHDTWVKTCYLRVPGAPVPVVDERSWSDYMAAISIAIRDDLCTQQDTWTALGNAANRDDNPPVSLVRLLDIVAWHAGQETQRFLVTSP